MSIVTINRAKGDCDLTGIPTIDLLTPYFDSVTVISEDNSVDPMVHKFRVSKASLGLDYDEDDDVAIVFETRRASVLNSAHEQCNTWLASINGVSTRVFPNNNDYKQTSNTPRYPSKA